MRKLLLLTVAVALLSCSHTPTRPERMEKAATEYMRRTTKPLKSHVIEAECLESGDTQFVGFVGYRCTIDNTLSAYKVVFVGVRGDSIVYVGNSEESANIAAFVKKR